jgi:hypothetical protein
VIFKIRNWFKARVAMARRRCVFFCGCGEVLNDEDQDSIYMTTGIYQHTCPKCGICRSFDFSYPANRSVMFVSDDRVVTLGSGLPH